MEPEESWKELPRGSGSFTPQDVGFALKESCQRTYQLGDGRLSHILWLTGTAETWAFHKLGGNQSSDTSHLWDPSFDGLRHIQAQGVSEASSWKRAMVGL